MSSQSLQNNQTNQLQVLRYYLLAKVWSRMLSGQDIKLIWYGYMLTIQVKNSIQSDTDVSANSISLSLSLFAVSPISSPLIPDYNESTSFFLKIKTEVVIVLGYFLSNSKKSTNKKSSELFPSSSTNSHRFAFDLLYNNPSSISTSRILWIFPVRG